MKRLALIALITGTALSLPAMAADVGVSVSVHEPGFYGRIDIGDFPRPALVYSQPVLVAPVPVTLAPIYLHVPPGHRKHWKRHCGEYGACGQPVYFVRDEWYLREYAPRLHDRHEARGGPPPWAGGRGHGHGRGHNRD